MSINKNSLDPCNFKHWISEADPGNNWKEYDLKDLQSNPSPQAQLMLGKQETGEAISGIVNSGEAKNPLCSIT